MIFILKRRNDIFLSNIYKRTLTLTAESSSTVFAINFMRSAGLLCPADDGGKKHESAYKALEFDKYYCI